VGPEGLGLGKSHQGAQFRTLTYQAEGLPLFITAGHSTWRVISAGEVAC
jgi:hypothetical protein